MNNLDRKVDDLELPIRVMSGLKTNGIDTVGDLVKLTEVEFLRTPKFGMKSLNEIKEVLSGMSLEMGETNGEVKTNGKAEKPIEFFKEFNFEVIGKIEKVALASLNHMIERKLWNQKDVGTIFNEHRKIIDTYEKATLDLWHDGK
tara:strand:+ start:52 stop:486 length:435 start_codon:yes stop_codon:yes gene_type:complete